MKRRTTWIAALVAALVIGAVPLVVQARGFHRHGRGEGGDLGFGFGRLERIKETLDLSDQQVVELKAVAKEFREQNASNREQLRERRQGVIQILLADPNNVSGAQALIDQQMTAERAVRTNLLNATAKALRVLTPEQRTRVSQHLAERGALDRKR